MTLKYQENLLTLQYFQFPLQVDEKSKHGTDHSVARSLSTANNISTADRFDTQSSNRLTFQRQVLLLPRNRSTGSGYSTLMLPTFLSVIIFPKLLMILS